MADTLVTAGTRQHRDYLIAIADWRFGMRGRRKQRQKQNDSQPAGSAARDTHGMISGSGRQAGGATEACIRI